MSLSCTLQRTARRRLDHSHDGCGGGTQQNCKLPRGPWLEAAALGRAWAEASSQGAVIRSTNLHICRLAVVHTHHWEAYARLLKLVEFRSPRQTIPFFPGMLLLLSLNAAERRTGLSGLLMADVLEVTLLEYREAYAQYPLEAHACNLKSFCKQWNNTVQCLALDKSSLQVAHEICHQAIGNLGVLRQFNDTTGTTRFCCREDLGKTVEVQLSTGKR